MADTVKMEEKAASVGTMDKKAGTTVELGIKIYGMYLGCSTRTFGRGAEAREVPAMMVALPGLGGAIEVGVNRESVEWINKNYDMGQIITVLVATPRAYNGRIYWEGLSLDGNGIG